MIPFENIWKAYNKSKTRDKSSTIFVKIVRNFLKYINVY